ncbi:MAG TPA: hydroxyacid dehydrogenase [Cyanobacteria bacterium UBA8530]|nr:hydroxyacid dehydrogenase [Cyanobacteria bacterium UBA8530]
MEKKPIFFFEVSDPEKAGFESAPCLEGHPLVLNPGRLTPENVEMAREAEILSVFIYSRLTAELLDALPNLRLIATRSTGYDHIDLAVCKKRGIIVSSVPSYGEDTVAEHTFALILSLSRNIHRAYVRTIRGNFSLQGLRGFDLKAKTLGVVGTGRIGLRVIKIAKGLGMNVIASDPRPNELLAEILDFRYFSFDEVLGKSDILSLHAPENERTRHMINRESIKKIKRGAILINTARGGLVDTDALTEALDEGILSGAGLDVFEGELLVREERQILREPLTQEKLKTLYLTHALLNRENVVITPHIGFDSNEAVERIVSTTLENICGFLEGHPLNAIH